MTDELIAKLKRQLAQLAVGPSALRNQGAAGLLPIARSFFEQLDLAGFVAGDRLEFFAALDRSTTELKGRFPPGARNWGAARKGLNLFLRDVLYSSYVSKSYGFSRARLWLELPLDSFAARGLAQCPYGLSLPRWPGIKHLQPHQSAQFQDVAAEEASSRGIARVDLDLWYWRSKEAEPRQRRQRTPPRG